MTKAELIAENKKLRKALKPVMKCEPIGRLLHVKITGVFNEGFNVSQKDFQMLIDHYNAVRETQEIMKGKK